MNSKLFNVAQLIVSTLNLSVTSTAVAARLAAAGDIDWPALVDHADGHSLTPLLYDVWQQAGALQFIPPDITARLARAYVDNAARNEQICQELLEIHHLLNAAGVPHLILKGWPLVERLYLKPAQRVLYDHDFLVPPDLAQAGQQALLAAGFKPLPAMDGWIEKHLSPLWRNPDYHWDGYLFDPNYPRPVELHTRLWEQSWRGLQVSQLTQVWYRVQSCVVAGEPMQLLADEDLLLHLAMHFTGHLIERQARLNQLLDLARLLQQAPLVDWELIWAQALSARIGRFVYASLYLAHQIFAAPLPPPHIWQRFSGITPEPFRQWLAEQGVSDALTADYRCRSRGQDYRLTFLAASSLQEQLGITRFALLPPLDQLVVKYNLSHRWLGPLFYPRYLVERIAGYSQSWLGRD